MQQYIDMLETILKYGHETGDRTGIGTISLPGYSYQVHLYEDDDGIIHNYPLLTTKEIKFFLIVAELLWKLSGKTNIRSLVENNVNIWTEWPFKAWLIATDQADKFEWYADEKKSDYSDEWKRRIREFKQRIINNDEFAKQWGNLGPTYGHHMRNFGEVLLKDIPKNYADAISAAFPDMSQNGIIVPGIDQVSAVLNSIRNNPEDRRIIMSLWNPHDNMNTLLPPCPCFYQFFANQKGYLHLNVYQRSCDSFLGVPFNDAQDALMLILFAKLTGRKPGIFTHMFGDVHIYINHVDRVKEQILREPRPSPSIIVNSDITSLESVKPTDFQLIGYNPHGPLRGMVAV